MRQQLLNSRPCYEKGAETVGRRSPSAQDLLNQWILGLVEYGKSNRGRAPMDMCHHLSLRQ